MIKALRLLADEQVVKSKQTSPKLPNGPTMSKALQDIIYAPEVWTTARRQFLADFTEVVQETTARGVTQAGRMVGGVNFDLANETVVTLSGGYTNEWYSTLNDSTQRQLRAAIAAHIQSGAPLPKLTKTLRPLFGAGRAKVIAATEVTRMFAVGNAIGYQTAGITTFEWRTTFDQRVCPICSSKNGEWYPIGGSERPPAHISCRCWIAPVVDGKPVLRSEQVLEDIIKQQSDRIRGNSTETGVFIDDDGRIIIDKSQGAVDSVTFTPDECLLARDTHMLHNHPSGQSFSDTDISFAVVNNVKSMRVAGSGQGDILATYDYVMQRPATGWPNIDEVRAMIKVHASTIRTEFEGAISAGTMTIPEANARHWHELWLRVSKTMGWTYRRTVVRD